MEQQFPFGQSPQTVPPLETPQVPSVVACAVDMAPAAAVEETGLTIGSADVVDSGIESLVLGELSVQPD